MENHRQEGSGFNSIDKRFRFERTPSKIKKKENEIGGKE